MLMRTDPFRDLDRLASQIFNNVPGTWSKPSVIPMDAYQEGEQFVVSFDLPGVSPDLIDLDVERNVLTVKAERRPPETSDTVEYQASERRYGVFSRQLFLGESLDTEHIAASFDAGVLTLRIPIAEQAKPRKISIENSATEPKKINA